MKDSVFSHKYIKIKKIYFYQTEILSFLYGDIFDSWTKVK